MGFAVVFPEDAVPYRPRLLSGFCAQPNRAGESLIASRGTDVTEWCSLLSRKETAQEMAPITLRGQTGIGARA